jgi:triacylglycerol lipase
LPAVRNQIAQMTATLSSPSPFPVDVEERTITAEDGREISVLIHRPSGLPRNAPALLYMHGGGFLVGSAIGMKATNQKLAAEAECLLVAVDYRLAPETPYPGALDDCYAALKWLHGEGETLGIDPARLAIAGESAGAGLAAALALLTRDRGKIPLIHQHLIYPMLDDRTNRANANPFSGQFVWSPESNSFGWSSLLGHPAGSEGVSPYAAPARAENLVGLPSTYIAVGALDLFVEEDMDYARRLLRAGVPTELHVYPGAYHGFELATDAAVTKKAHDNSLSALRKALHPAARQKG